MVCLMAAKCSYSLLELSYILAIWQLLFIAKYTLLSQLLLFSGAMFINIHYHLT